MSAPFRIVPLAAALALAGACSGESGPRPRNLVLITIDTTRADHVGAYGSPLGVTPRIDALAERGVVFETAYAPMAQTLPSHATMFTGLGPRRHGALENVYVLEEEQLTLAEICRERGFATGGFIGALAIDDLTGIHQGFQRFDQPRAPGSQQWEEARRGHPPQRKAREVTDAALSWAEGLSADEPFLLWAHYYDPHGDSNKSFEPPPKHLAAIDRGAVRAQVAAREGQFRGVAGIDALTDFWAAYAAEIRFMDAQIGRLLDGLEQDGLLEDTAVVVVADHGEGLYEHGQKAHGTHLWEEQIAIPFVIVHPDGSLAGTRVQGLVMLEDLLPTVLHLVFGPDHGLSTGGDGIDLWSHLAGPGGGLPERAVVTERPHYGPERLAGLRRGQDAREFQWGFKLAVRRGDHKLVQWPDRSVQLFDLASDPAELVDRSADLPDVAARLQDELQRWARERPVSRAPGDVGEVSEEKMADLKALGYVGDDGDG